MGTIKTLDKIIYVLVCFTIAFLIAYYFPTIAFILQLLLLILWGYQIAKKPRFKKITYIALSILSILSIVLFVF